jgi:hypothetical protein
MKKLAAALVTAISTALAMAAPVVFAPPAHAEACAAVHGRHITAGLYGWRRKCDPAGARVRRRGALLHA